MSGLWGGIGGLLGVLIYWGACVSLGVVGGENCLLVKYIMSYLWKCNDYGPYWPLFIRCVLACVGGVGQPLWIDIKVYIMVSYQTKWVL